MDEIADLIRLLAEAPAEEPPMLRPKSLLDRVQIEKVANEGVVQPGPAVPNASPVPKEEAPGRRSSFKFTAPEVGRLAGPAPKQDEVGAVASPSTAVPAVPVQTSVKLREDLPGVLALPKTATAVPDGTSKPLQPGRDHIVSPETFAGRTATPKIAESIRAVPASIRNRETVTAVGQVNPKTQVTVSVPPAFPYDPQEAFAAVDDMLNLPPQTQGVKGRQILAPANTDDLESTEAYVARKYREREGSFSDLDRWQL